jgi:two-component system, NtrC family, sensor histidine kinase KinB
MISLRHKLWIGFGTLLLILLVVSFLTTVMLTGYSHTLERIFRENYDSVTYCDQMKDAVHQLNLRALLLIWNPGPPDQIDADAEIDKFQLNLNQEYKNITLPGEREHTDHLDDLWRQYQNDLGRFDAAPAPKRAQIYSSSLLPGFKQIHETAQWIADANISNMVSVDGRVKRTLVEVRNWLLILSFAGTLAAALAVGAAGTSILRPLRNLMLGARQIERGDLDLNLPVRSRDEIGELAEAFNSMAVKLREFRQLDHNRLLRTQQTTQLAIDSLPDAVFIIGPTGIVEISNLMASAHFGIQPGLEVQVLGGKLKWLLPLYETVKSNHEPPRSTGYASAIQLFEDGQERFLLPHAVPMLGIDGGVIGVCVILVDVTALRSADEAKSNLVSTVSHELRTPLTSIRMAMNLLHDPKFGSLGPKQSALLEAARQDSDRLYRIIENLLSISRIESGRAQFQFRQISPAEIVANAVDPMRPAFAEKRLKLQVNAAPDLPSVLADPVAIGSALTNLLSNALKFTPAGGEVSVNAEIAKDMVCFTVADTGPGIPDQYVSRIFDKFFRIPSKDGPTGAGLGLAIARDIAQAHGGSIELSPGKKLGSEFRLILPLTSNLPAKP